MPNFDDELREYEKRNEEKIQAFFKSLVDKMPLFIAIAIAIFWIFYGTVEVFAPTITITERIGLSICTVVLAVTYCGLIQEGGFTSAKKSNEYKKAEELYEKAVNAGNTNKSEIREYAHEIARQNLYECRKNNLEANILVYSDYFDQDGKYIGGDYKHDKTLNKSQKKCLKKAVSQRIILPNIFGNISSRYFGLRKETNEKDYRLKTTISQTVFRTIVSVASVGFMFRFLGLSVGSMVYALFQIVLWTASGFSQRIKNFNFVMDNTIPQMKERTLIINGYLALNNEEKRKYRERSQQ